MTITTPASSVVNEIAYQREGLTTNKAYLVGQQSGANGTIWIKNSNSATTGSDATDTTINLNLIRSGTSNAHTVVYVPRTNSSINWNEWVVFTNLGAMSFSDSTDAVNQNVVQGAWAFLQECEFSTFDNSIYCLRQDADLIYQIDPQNIGVAIQAIDFGIREILTFAIDGTSGFIFVGLTSTTGNPTVSRFNMATNTIDLDITGNTACDEVMQGISVDTVNDNFWVSCSSDSSVRKYSQSGTALATVASITTPRYQELDSIARRMYVVSETTDQVQIWDIDANVALFTQSVCNYQTSPLDIRRQSDHIKVGIPCLSTSTSQLIDDSSPADLTEGEVAGANCEVDYNFDGVEDVVFTDVGGPEGAPTTEDPDGGVPDGMCDGRPIQHIQAGSNTTESFSSLACTIGLYTDNDGDGICPDDPDVRTNGIGFMLIVLALALMITLFAVAKLKTSLTVPEWVWIIGTLSILGVGVGLGWIDATFFIIGVITIVALASFRFAKSFGLGDF
jgi:hypothetical protein